jgi:hypothetical protein
MDPGRLEEIPLPFEQALSSLEQRVMTEIVRAIRINGFSTSTADWQTEKLIQMGKSEAEIQRYVQEALQLTNEELEKVYSDEVYAHYYGYSRAYKKSGFEQIPLEQNAVLQSVMNAAKVQTRDTFRNMTASMGFAIRNPATGKISYSPLMDFYQNTLDSAVMDIMSGSMSYDKVLSRTINMMTTSGLRWIDYDSGAHFRVNVAARMAVMTGFRQVQGKINEQVANELGTDSYEVSFHLGARPTHQVWQGRVYTYKELESVCGLGTVTGLHGANCYHDYTAFVPGVSVRNYTDEELNQMMAEENTPKSYNGKEYTTYEALQEQRRLETLMRKSRQDIALLKEGGADKKSITLRQCRYRQQQQQYRSFSKVMKLPQQMERVYGDGLKVKAIRNNQINESDIGKHLLNKIVGVSKQKKAFQEGLETIKNEDIRKLLRQSFHRTEIVRAEGRRSYYSSKDKNVYLSGNARAGTIAHELFHEIDDTYGLVNNGLLSKSVRSDFHRLQQQSVGYGKAVDEMLYARYPDAFRDNGGKLVIKEEYRGISDIIHGCSKGEIFLGYGHRGKGYWENSKKLEKETFAQYGRMMYDNNKDVLNMFNELFPSTKSELSRTIKGMIK